MIGPRREFGHGQSARARWSPLSMRVGRPVRMAAAVRVSAAVRTVLQELGDLQIGDVLARRLAVVADRLLLRLVHHVVANLGDQIEGRGDFDRKPMIIAALGLLRLELRAVSRVLAFEHEILALQLLDARAEPGEVLAQFPNPTQRVRDLIGQRIRRQSRFPRLLHLLSHAYLLLRCYLLRYLAHGYFARDRSERPLHRRGASAGYRGEYNARAPKPCSPQGPWQSPRHVSLCGFPSQPEPRLSHITSPAVIMLC